MNTTSEKDPPLVPVQILAAVLLTLVSGAVGLAYLGGVFTGKEEVIANDKRIQTQTSMVAPSTDKTPDK